MREIRVLLVGRTGHGKSSVGNTLLGRDHFEVSHGAQSCTKICKYGETERNGTLLVVTDTPGIFDTAIPRLELMKELIRALGYMTPGFHVIAFVLRPDRFTPELQETQRLFFEWFGGNVRDYACLILTHSSSDADIRKFTDDPHPSLQELVQGCGGVDSILPFENTATPAVREAQVKRFLDHVIDIQRRNGDRYFSNLAFNISKAYADNRDLDTITSDSLLCLENAGQRFFRDSMNSLRLVEEPRPRDGKLKIFGLGDTDSNGGRIDPGPAEKDIPLVNVAADITMSDEVSETRLYDQSPRAQTRVIPSSRRNRVFVNTDDTTPIQQSPRAPTRVIPSSRRDRVFVDTDDTTPIQHSARSQLPSGYTGVNQSPGGYATTDQSAPRQNRSQMAGAGQGLPPANLASHQRSVMPPAHASSRSGRRFVNDPHSTGSGSGLGSDQSGNGPASQPPVIGAHLSGGSEDYTNHRERMNNEENVNKFIRILQYVGEKIKQFLLGIKSKFTSGNRGQDYDPLE